MMPDRRAVLALPLALGACAAPQVGDVRVSTDDAPAAARRITALRAARGLGPVRLDEALVRAAAEQVRAMAVRGILGHDAGGSIRDRLIRVGIRDVPAAENIGRGHATLEAALSAWQASPSHAANLFAPALSRVGMARADAPRGPWWALVMAGEAIPGQTWRPV